jgi:hypothetical protein
MGELKPRPTDRARRLLRPCLLLAQHPALLRRALPVLVTAFAAAIAAVPPLGAGQGSSGPTSATRALCGVERWTVKTLQDRPRPFAT